MGIIYDAQSMSFMLNTPNTSYAMAVAYKERMLAHLYYGRRLNDADLRSLINIKDIDMSLNAYRDKVNILDSLMFEYPVSGCGDYREACLEIKGKTCELLYAAHRIYSGKIKPNGYPAAFASEGECETLEITCVDKAAGLEVILFYSVFNNLDIIARRACVKNNSGESLFIKRALSACLDIRNDDFEMIRLHGSWARERHISREIIGYGKTAAGSVRGISSHQENPFMALAHKHTTEDYGDVYALSLIYSGNHLTQAERTQFDYIRAVIGINPNRFSWELKPQDIFTTPEAILTYSKDGFGEMTRTFHDLYRNHLIRGRYAHVKRPVLINNWEATYFDFDTDKLLSIARKAAKLGIELFVLDDGWFGKRGDDNSSLGDWTVNTDKLKGGGLKYLADEINKLGMSFGLWFEPEMVSPDSDLYRAHPDYVLSGVSLCRNQYALDLSRADVRDYIYGSISAVLKSANIVYVKWDMNRPLTGADCTYSYVLGLYELQERLINDFPDILLENCAGGGGRFDPGMLYYSPQIWCSDNTDAIERLIIQEGTAMVYPLSAIGAHVSVCPNHITRRATPFKTRGIVALAGTFGFELDVTKLTADDEASVKELIQMYHRYNDLIRDGDYYRLASYARNGRFDSWQIVSKDKRETLVSYVIVKELANMPGPVIRLKGLNTEFFYKDDSEDIVYSGAYLCRAGLTIPRGYGDYTAGVYHFTAEK